ncbi:MAG: glycosyltransferase [Gammaproteobacteria bacterium]
MVVDKYISATTQSVINHYSALARSHKLEFKLLSKVQIEPELFDINLSEQYLKLQAIPIASDPDALTIATSNPSVENCESITEFWSKGSGKNVKIVVASRQDILDVLSQVFVKENVHKASYGFNDLNPKMSAKRIFNVAERIALLVLIYVLISGFVFYPKNTILFGTVALTLGTFLCWGYKFFLTVINIIKPINNPKFTLMLNDEQLPIYTVLVPLLRENESIIKQLITSLSSLNYPPDKLDIKILLEDNDEQSSSVIRNFELPSNFHVVYVPPGEPRSKPRACNYGLLFAIGEYVTIYDAEDLPDLGQLKKVVQCFQEGDEKLVCVQAILNFYNARDNLLSRFFTIEYTTLFDQILSGIASLKLLIPLGGTSNHFKATRLRELGAWDPFNVTEDADIGIRLYRYGYTSTVTNSTTMEEANSRLINWLRQRTRWNKGYLTCYFVHMRHPIKLFKQLGLKNFLHFQIIVGGSVFAQLANLPLWIALLGTLFFPIHFTQPKIIWAFAWINFSYCNLLYTAAHFIGVMRRKLYFLIPTIPFMIFYWMYMSVASFYALYELIVRPTYWYKTEHGVSKFFNKKKKG